MSSCDFSYLTNIQHSEDAPFFVDQYGRCLIFHGINVSGATKLPAAPYPDCLYPESPAFWDPSASFVGRPFPLKDAKEHFSRLRTMGTTLIRFVLTWESIEPRRGFYDDDYLSYLEQVLQIGSDLGFLFILDCHQDCWSRFCGGSGAPLWTLELAGLNPRALEACGAVLLQSPQLSSYAQPGTLWATNYTKFATNHLFTLFFGGEVFIERSHSGEEKVGHVLRQSYYNCFGEVAKRVGHISGVLGFDPMNEPHHGFIGLESLEKFDEDVLLHLGHIPSARQSMKLASGIPQKVPLYRKSWPKPTSCIGYELLNENGTSAWKDRADDIWREVWESSSEEHFSRFPAWHERAGQTVSFQEDFYVPFLREFDAHIKKIMPKAILFVEPIPNSVQSPIHAFSQDGSLCYAPHWYDLKALFEKRFSKWFTMNVQALSRGSRNIFAHSHFGYSAAIRNYTKQIATLFQSVPHNIPRIIGECGIPFDMNRHYEVSKLRGQISDYKSQGEMLDILCRSLELNLLSWTLWNYTPENRAYEGGGDFWNGEDFSVYCASEAELDCNPLSQYAGIRSPRSFIRPYGTKIAGMPVRSHFDLRRTRYVLEFFPNSGAGTVSQQTEIFIPRWLHDEELKIEFTGVKAEWSFDQSEETLVFQHDTHGQVNQETKCQIVVQFGEKDVWNASRWIWQVFFLVGILLLSIWLLRGATESSG